MKITGPVVVRRKVLCVQCQTPYRVGFTSQNRAKNPRCPESKCGSSRYSFLPNKEIESMVVANLLAVRWVVNRLLKYFPSRVVEAVGGIEEMDAEGRLALLDAAHHYDPKRLSKATGLPVAFNTYAVRSMEMKLRGWIDSQLRHGANGEPTLTENRKYVKDTRPTLSFQAIMDRGANGEAVAAGDPFFPDHRVKSALDGAVDSELCSMIALLDPRRRHVMEAIFFRGLTLVETARELRISKERVRQNKAEGLKKLTDLYGQDAPEEFVKLDKNRRRYAAHQRVGS